MSCNTVLVAQLELALRDGNKSNGLCLLDFSFYFVPVGNQISVPKLLNSL